MDWRIKLLAQKALDLSLPGELGRRAHERLQQAHGSIGRWNEEKSLYEIDRGLQMAQYLFEQGGGG